MTISPDSYAEFAEVSGGDPVLCDARLPTGDELVWHLEHAMLYPAHWAAYIGVVARDRPNQEPVDSDVVYSFYGRGFRWLDPVERERIARWLPLLVGVHQMVQARRNAYWEELKTMWEAQGLLLSPLKVRGSECLPADFREKVVGPVD